MIRFTCSNCGRKFAVKDELAGRRSKCPGCAWEIAVPARTEGVDIGTRPVVSVRTEGMVTVPDPPESRLGQDASRGGSRRLLLAGSMGGNLLLGLLVGYLVWARSRTGADASVPPPRADVSPAAIQIRSTPCDYREVLLKMKMRSLTDTHPGYPDENLTKALRESREFQTPIIKSMPEGDEGMNLLIDVLEYFTGDTPGDPIELWICCRTARDMLSSDDIRIEPIDVLKGMKYVVDKCWTKLVQETVIKKKNAYGEFVLFYVNLRKEGLSHERALDEIVKDILGL